jgi:hypothetical protein
MLIILTMELSSFEIATSFKPSTPTISVTSTLPGTTLTTRSLVILVHKHHIPSLSPELRSSTYWEIFTTLECIPLDANISINPHSSAYTKDLLKLLQPATQTKSDSAMSISPPLLLAPTPSRTRSVGRAVMLRTTP